MERAIRQSVVTVPRSATTLMVRIALVGVGIRQVGTKMDRPKARAPHRGPPQRV